MLSTPYTLLLLAAAAVSAALAFYVWRRRDARGAGAVVLMMLAVFVWSFGYAFEIGAADLGAKVFWAKVEYLGIVTVPFAWLIFALRYTGRDHALTRRNLALLAVVPLATLLLVATNEAHGLIWSRTALSPSGWFLTLEYGAGFWVYWVYSYVLLVLGTFYLISMRPLATRVPRAGRGPARGRGGTLGPQRDVCHRPLPCTQPRPDALRLPSLRAGALLRALPFPPPGHRPRCPRRPHRGNGRRRGGRRQ